MVRVEQRVDGKPVFQSETRVTLTAEGRIVRVVGGFAPQAAATAPAAQRLISAKEALVSAMASVKVQVSADLMSAAHTNADGSQTEVVPNDSDVPGNVPSKLVYFPLAPGVLVPAWSQISFTADGGAWYTLVDAGTGDILWRKSIKSNATDEDARFRVYVQGDGKTPADNPAPLSPTTVTQGSGTQPPEIMPTIVSMHAAFNSAASPNGWIDDGGTTTQGNNVHAYMDRAAPANVADTDAASVLDGDGKPVGNPDIHGRSRDFLGTTPRDFQTGYLPPPQGGNPEAGQTATGNGNSGTLAIDSFRRGAVTQLFYISNWFHDELFALGFDEAAGNFQTLNFSGDGLGGDAVLAECQDSSGTNNANFATPPDGQAGRMQMFRFTGPTIDRDASLDAEIVIHELAHGLSNRLVGNGAGLEWAVGGAMGEGWSDFYALSLLNRTHADDPDASYAAGGYSTYKLTAGFTDNYLYGIRRFPYSTDNSVNPLTWADIDDTTADLSGGLPVSPPGYSPAGMAVHNAGEVWCLSLWEMRSRIIADTAGANGNVPDGNHTTLQLVTDAMKMTPAAPSFIEARDALLDADAATNALANEESIWGGFADRGLGYKALAPQSVLFGYNAGHLGIRESFDRPYLDVASVTVNDAVIGNNNGVLDPNEPSYLSVNLTNPWRHPSKAVTSATATLTSSTPGVNIITGSSTYGAIAPQGTTGGTPFRIRIPASATAGQSIHFTLTVTSALGVKSVDFIQRIGTPGGAGAPITYTKSESPGLGIPDDNAKGVTSLLTVTDDLEIMDVDFRVDSLIHTYTGDLSVLLKGPNGFGIDLIAVIGGLTDGGPGDNLINMVIDDEATANFIAASGSSAPFTGSWRPIFNQPEWTLAGFAGPETVGELSRFDGSSTAGTWAVQVSDQFAADTGTLNSWSIIVTPREYTASAYIDAPEIQVESPVDTALDDAANTLDFGTVNLGSNSAPLTVKVINEGTIDLNISGIATNLGDAGDFTIDLTGTDLVLGAEESTTFTVTFTPTSGGSRSTTLQITSDDADEGIFDITLEGFCNTAPVVTLTGANPLMLAPSPTYTDPGASALDGEDGPLIPIITTNTVVPNTPGVYQVIWTATDSSSATGTATRTVIVQPGALDKKAPVVAITLPTAKTKTVPAAFDIHGTVSDNFGLLSFEVTLNGTPLVLDAPLAFSPNTAIPWSVSGAVAENGPNLIQVTATDLNGKVTKAARVVTHVNSRPALSGTYTAWLAPDGTPALGKTGLIQVSVADSGYFTGKVTLGGVAAAFRGYLANDGNARFLKALGNNTELLGGLEVYQRPKKKNRSKKAAAVYIGTLAFQIVDPGLISGSVTDRAPTLQSIFKGSKAPFNRGNPVPLALLNQPALGTPVRGYYTVAFTSKAQSPPLLPTLYPQGDGYASLTLASTGGVSLSGYLADGTKYTSAGLLRGDQTVALHRVLYSGKGSKGGDLTFQDLPNSDVRGEDLLWIRPPLPKSRTYKLGWPEGVRTDAIGARFALPASLNYGQGPHNTATGNSRATFESGKLASPVNFVLSIDPVTGAFVTVPAKNANFTFSLNRASGAYSGRFRHEDGSLALFRGVLVRRGTTLGGFGYFLSNGADGESGSVSIAPLAPPP